MKQLLWIAAVLTVVPTIAGSIPAPGFQPSGLAHDGAQLYVAENSGARRIFTLEPESGAVLGSFLAPSRTGLDGRGIPNGLVHDGNGRLFVADIDQVVFEIDETGGAMVNSFELPFRGSAIAFDGTSLYVADLDSGEVIVVDRAGNPLGGFTTSLRPAGMSFDAVTGTLWVVDIFDSRISQITTDGEIVRRCDGPHVPGPQGLGGLTLTDHRLFIAEVSDPDPFNPPDLPGTIHVSDRGALVCDPPLQTTVAVDVRPGNPVTPIRPNSRGLIPVALLADAELPVAGVLPESARFGVVGGEAIADRWRVQDVNHDGLQDLLFWFPVAATGIRCGDESATLTAVAKDGRQLTGTDSIRTVGCR